MKSLIPLTLAFSLTTPHAGAHARPDDHAPISIMGEHTHAAGEWMLSYRHMFMDMDGMYRGSDEVAPAAVHGGGYVVSPARMTMDMHMLGMMFAPTDRVTLMAMLPYTDIEMDHLIAAGAAPLIGLNGGGRTFTTGSEGIGDLKFTALVDLFASGPHHLHAGAGVSLPTGSIGEKDLVPGPGGRLPRQLPASMQLGSGSLDVMPSLTYVYRAPCWSAGIQAGGTWRTETNHHDYRLGDRFDLKSWFAYKITPWLSLGGGLSYHWEDELAGVQSDIMRTPPFAPSMRAVPTAFGENYGGQRIEALAGVNVVIPDGPLTDHRLAADVRVPLWRDRNGYALGTDYTVTLGWQYAF